MIFHHCSCSCYDEEEDNCAGFDEEKVHLDEDVLGLEIPVSDRGLQALALARSKLTWDMLELRKKYKCRNPPCKCASPFAIVRQILIKSC